MVEDTLFAFEGEYARVLALGSTSHSVEGVIVHADHHGLELTRAGSTSPLRLPAEAIVTIDIRVANDQWHRASLPLSLANALDPISKMFFTGTRAINTNYTTPLAKSDLKALERSENALIDYALREAVSKLHDSVQRYIRAAESRNFVELESSVNHARSNIDTSRKALADANPPIPVLIDAGVRFSIIVDTLWQRESERYTPRPRLVARESTPQRIAVKPNLEFDLPFRLELAERFAPAEDLLVIIPRSESVDFLGGEPHLPRLQPGQVQTVHQRCVLRNRSLLNQSLKLRAQLQLKTLTGGIQLTPLQDLEFILVPEADFERIPNPYSAYAGGTSVGDPAMFFGRESLLHEIVEELAGGPPGQGFALYGQKRSGKTSLLEQLERRCSSQPLIPVSLSIGLLDPANLSSSFSRTVLGQLRVKLSALLPERSSQALLRTWPSDEKIEARPTESLSQAFIAGRELLKRIEGWTGLRYVLLVDEFTYLFELHRTATETASRSHQVREFLRQWKALLESRAFSSVVVGQDTMPYFMQQFPNEFSAMRTWRLSYLDARETRDLADFPIRDNADESRHTGYSLESIYQYTAGHPYFTQVLCDTIVRLANERRQSSISESLVQDAAESLISGKNRLDPYRFDCLLTADNTGFLTLRDHGSVVSVVDDADSDLAFSFLARLANLQGSSARRVRVEDVVESDDDSMLLSDLLVRDVVSDDGGLSIRVELFAEYLRQNS